MTDSGVEEGDAGFPCSPLFHGVGRYRMESVHEFIAN